MSFDEHRPELTSVHRDNILDLLCKYAGRSRKKPSRSVADPCSLLQPLGDHRRTHLLPSKGKKRKRKANSTPLEDEPPEAAPPRPEVGSYILTGLNSVTRHLEALAAHTAPPVVPLSANGEGEEPVASAQSLTPISLVVIPHNHPPSSLPHAHIPTLVHLSTLNQSSITATRLIAIPPSYEPRLATALHIPHVGALGILEGAPGAGPLVDYVREHVETTSCTWIDEAMRAEWKGVKIDAQKA